MFCLLLLLTLWVLFLPRNIWRGGRRRGGEGRGGKGEGEEEGRRRRVGERGIVWEEKEKKKDKEGTDFEEKKEEEVEER